MSPSSSPSSVELDEITNLVQFAGVSARLSEQEKRLLALFRARPGTALGKRALMQTLWGHRAEWMEDSALVQLVSRLRGSLAPLGLERCIVTVARVGYRYDPPERAVERVADRLPYGAALPHCIARDGYGEVRRGTTVVRIPQLEYRLLCALLSPAQIVHDKRALIALLWPARPGQDDTNLMQVVSRLRRKLIPLDLHERIVTVPREGYRFAVPTADTSDDRMAARVTAYLCKPARQWHHVRRWLTRHLRWRTS